MSTLPLFSDCALLQQALTHRSYVNEHPEVGEHNERLEFLGDAILNFLGGEFLYQRYAAKPEGELTSLRSALVDEKQLAQFAVTLKLGNLMRLGNGAEQEGGRHNPNLLSSTFEAIVGAYFLDAGSDIQAVRAFVSPLFCSVVDNLMDSVTDVNFKSRLQAWALAKFAENPKYVPVDQSGPDHAPKFVAEVWIADQKWGEGRGKRKQDAEKQAAEEALKRIEGWTISDKE